MARKWLVGTPNNFFRISMSSAKVYLPVSSYLKVKLAPFHWIYYARHKKRDTLTKIVTAKLSVNGI